MGNNNETQQMTSGQEKRLARKKAAEAAKTKKALTKIITWVVCAVIICAAVVGSVFYFIKKSKETKVVSDYSKGLTSEGFIKDVDVASSISTIDYKNLSVDYSEIEFTEEDMQSKIDSLLAEHATEDENGEKVTPEFNDDFTMQYFNMTEADYREMLKEDSEDAELEEYIENLLTEGTTVNVMPESYLKTVKGLIKYSDQRQFNYYQQLLAAYGSTQKMTFDSYTGMTTEQYETYLDETARKQIAGEMAAQYIFQNAGLSISDEDYSEYVSTFGTDAESTYGKPYIMRSLMFEKVVTYIKENITINK